MHKRPGSEVVRWLLPAAITLCAAGMVSAAYQAVAEACDRKRYPPPGRMADVGGRRLHFLDMGSGSPAVVIVPALGGNTLDLLGFYRDLADEDMRVVVYDRAGFGWSDSPPRGGRTFGDMADELRNGLIAAGIGPPYVLAGHSIGGIVARQFAARHPGDVAGMVLIDSSHEDQTRRYPGRGMRTAWYALRRRSRILGARRLLAMTGHSQLNDDVATDVPPEFTGAALAVNLTARHRRNVVREMMLIARSQGDPPQLGDLPLMVLTAARRDDATWMGMQRELAGLSTASKHIVADYGGHYLQRDNPDLVSSAVRDLVRRIREASN